MRPPESEVRRFLDEKRVAEFWDATRGRAGEEQQSGYLTDEWPPAMAANRLDGEWRDVCRWIRRYCRGRAACLDVGCGVGAWLQRLAPMFDRTIGIDVSEEMVASARSLLGRSGIANAQVERRGVLEMEFSGSHDFVFAGGVLMYVDDRDLPDACRRLRDAVAPGGLLVARESTHRGRTWYRDKPLLPGLHADPAQKRLPYQAIYRPPETIRTHLDQSGFLVREVRPNIHYKLSDITEEWLRAADRWTGGRLAADRERAARVAARIHYFRWLTLLPKYYAIRWFNPSAWSINNHWFVCTPRPSPGNEPTPGGP